jgi:hypothetical protein
LIRKTSILFDDEIDASKNWQHTIENNDITVLPFQIGDRKKLD